ncbi:MFS transporter [Colletotrichum higginsianum]|uniref:MFS transporter n=1 Tax=Colletotrichum higginsianum (strain IMI 349063) TaxID=759273 RepID=H1VQK8_COLHI|nr:MFS transporter [Colletotrichum higginsianum]
MAANKPLDDGHVSAGVVGGEANSINRVDTANDDADFQKMPKMDKVDEFGAHAKTDPKEIALVKKLDAYIIPILWLMYLFNFLDRNAIINARLNGLERTSAWSEPSTTLVYLWPDPIQHDSQQGAAVLVHGW